MATQNNLRIPDDLLNELIAAARAQGKTVEDLVIEAMRKVLEHRALDELAARGRLYAQRAGNPDPVKAVRDVRRGA